MKKIALLIGVSDYSEPHLQNLPAAIADIEALRRVLQDPNIGGFEETDIVLCPNPNRQTMEEAIYQLFSKAQKDDLVLFYFSGHGVIF